MFTSQAKIIIADLQSKIDNIDGGDSDQSFFMKLADYGKFLIETETTRKILSSLQEQARNDIQGYECSFLEFIEKWKEYASDLLVLAKKAGFEDDYSDPFNSTMGTIERILSGKRPIKSSDSLGDYWMQYSFLANRFHKENKVDMIIPKHLKKLNNFYNLQRYYNHAVSEWDRFRTHRQIQTWWAYNQVERLAITAYNLDPSKRIIKGASEGDEFYASDFRQILKGRQPQLAKRKEFQKWIKMVHAYIIPRLESLSESTKTTASNIKFENGALNIPLSDGTTIPLDFTTQNGRNDMLELFTILYRHWQKHEEEPIPTTELRIRLASTGLDQEEVQRTNFVSDTVSNIRKKIRGRGLGDTVYVEYDRKEKGYYLKILTTN